MNELTTIFNFIIITSIIWGILNLVLFIKIWGMTDDVSELKKIISRYINNQETTAESEKSSDGFSKIGDKIKKSDKILYLKDNKTYDVIGVNKDGEVYLDLGLWSGNKWISPGEYELISEKNL